MGCDRVGRLVLHLTNEGRFDGAILVDGRGYRSIEDVEGFIHKGDRLVLIIRKPAHYVVQFLCKRQPAWSDDPIWDDCMESSVVSVLRDAERLAHEFVV